MSTWHFLDKGGQQKGPVSLAELQQAWDANQVDGTCFAWAEGMAGWEAIAEIDALKEIHSPAPAPPPVSIPPTPAAAPTPATAAAPTHSRVDSTASDWSDDGGSSGGFNRAALANQILKKSQPTLSSVPETKIQEEPTPYSGSSSPSSAAKARSYRRMSSTFKKPNVTVVEVEWVELKTVDGVPYYYNKTTNETSWDKPDCLKTDEELDKKGDWVWIPDQKEGFVPARKGDVFSDGSLEVERENGERETISAKVVKTLDPLSWSSLRRLVRDLVMLDAMNLPLILHNLKERFMKNEIYTNVGTILISINPYQRLPIYTPTIIDQYRTRGMRKLAPHVFTIADDAWRRLTEFKKSQSIVISGESGAGKTECTKQCLQYLAEVAGSSETNVEQQILMANPILEAFGNAKTVRNNNSSRFGKYVEIFFDARGSICGARNTNYLLEKSRVVQQSGPERNYHIFYQLCLGLSPSQLNEVFLTNNPLDYSYLNQSGDCSIDGQDDKEEMEAVEKAFEALEFETDESKSIIHITAGVLHLGNISFNETGEKKVEIKNDSRSQKAISSAASLFQVSEESLKKCITTRLMKMRGETINITLGNDEAVQARNALAKFVYAALFDWLVLRINKSIGVGNGKKGQTIGILDIFGFEIFEVNSFEQLCINYCNEKLQRFFNDHTFKEEESVYKSEEIKFVHVEYIDNQPVLDLIEKKPHGILPSIDEELRMPKGSDKSLIGKLHQKHRETKTYQKILRDPDKFMVNHYAGDVTYDIDDFLEKNRDRLSEDLYGMLNESKSNFLKNLFAKKNQDEKSRKKSLGFKFSNQLNALMTTLNTTEPHYIRCIKPNTNKAKLEFNAPMCLQQLRYSGVFEAVTIRKKGFPFRLTHNEFMKRFKCISPNKSWTDDKKACVELIQDMKQNLDDMQMGKTRVLYRAAQHREIELQRNVAVEATALYLQRMIRGWLARKLKNELLAIKPVLEAAMRERTLTAVDKALSQAAGLKFPLLQWEQCKILKDKLVREKALLDKLEVLQNKDAELHLEEYCKAIAEADDLEMKSPIVEKCRKAMVEVQDKKKARQWLQEGVDEADEEKLTWAIKRAAELKLQRAEAAIEKAKKMQERIQKEKEYIGKLTAGLATGKFPDAEADKNVISWTTLQSAVSEAKSFEMKTKEGVKLFELGTRTIDIRQKLQAAVGTKDKQAWQTVDQAIVAALEQQHDSEEIKFYSELVAHQQAVDEVIEKLEAAVQELSQERLEDGLRRAQTLEIDEQKYPVVPAAREFLARIVECKSLMNEAMTQVAEQQLCYAIEYAESFSYDNAEVDQCRHLRDTVMQLNVESEHALDQLEEEPMKDCLERAEAIGLQTETITRINELIRETSEDKFVQLQLKAAVRLNDPSRVTRVTIRLKDLFFAKQGKMFVLKNYAKLLPPMGWANLKLITFKRQELADGFRRWTKSPIHDALTEMPSKQSKLATRMFKNLMGWMGDRSYESPFVLAREILQNCLDNPWLRDEVYCQIIKQVTQNPNRESSSKGWQMMAICLETFPPQSEFENYLEIWLRNNADPAERYVRLMHATVYGGARTTPPSEYEMRDVIAGKSLRTVQYETKSEYIVPRANIPPKGQAAAYAASAQDHKQQAPPQTTHQQAHSRGPPPSQPQRPQRPGAPSARPAPPPPQPKKQLWAIAHHPTTGQEYYYNTETMETTWERPPGL